MENYECHFSKFCVEVVDDVANTLDMCVTKDFILSVTNTKYRNDLVIRELICKFPTFVIQEIYKVLDLDDRIRPYILNFE